MEVHHPVPEAISHRQLTSLLRNAVAEAATAAEEVEGQRRSEVESALRAYGQVSQRLLKALEGSEAELGQGRSPRQLMAIGALQAHVRMALQALAASQA
jgi:hypothetical protein